MHEITIKYSDPKILGILRSISKYFNFIISLPKEKKNELVINGVSIIPANSSIDTSDLSKIFTGKNINSKALRKESWQRRK